MSPFNVYDTSEGEYHHRSGILFEEGPAKSLDNTEDPRVVVVTEEATGNVVKGIKGRRTWVECYRSYEEPLADGSLYSDMLSMFSFESN